MAASVGANPRFAWTAALHGFAAELNQGQVRALQHHPKVRYIEEDQQFQLDGTQYSAPWGLDRIDQRARPVNGTFTYESDGAGVRAYVIDSGILTSHTDFGGRASVGADFVNDGQNGIDCHGHGTHVAGTIGGATYGVAKGVSLVAVRVASCSGGLSASQIVSAMNWVTANRVLPAVVNASLSAGTSATVDTATNAMISAGVSVVVSAGNDGINACNITPARVPAAITVGATSSNDARAVWNSFQSSNFGSCLDLFAPGTGIVSDSIGSTTDTGVMSGTSMASPHVAGAAARYLQYYPTATPATVASHITGIASTGYVSNAGTGSPNRLLFAAIPLPYPVVSVSYPSNVPTISWGSLANAQYYSVDFVALDIYEDVASNIYTVSQSGDWLGYAYGTSITDSGGRTFTGSASCIWSSGMYTTSSSEYYYDITAVYPDGSQTTRVQAEVGAC
ncbi:MAG TPA: S8 family serine peptidase [Longimicrobium sp.]|uniref:S8 family peptidase n=1 Tax=Longimicrobium sp. TaxID=2029185 RepID=UPI002ED8FEDF